MASVKTGKKRIIKRFHGRLVGRFILLFRSAGHVWLQLYWWALDKGRACVDGQAAPFFPGFRCLQEIGTVQGATQQQQQQECIWRTARGRQCAKPQLSCITGRKKKQQLSGRT